MITRFSPSPTGHLHIGNARVALINYLYSLKQGGEFLLRIDDTDLKRCKAEYTEAIIADLKWLGLEFSQIIKQSSRLDVYEKIKNDLIAAGKLYPCFETEAELAMARKIQNSRGVPPIYDRKSYNLTKEQIAELIESGHKPYYRFLLDDKEISFNDKIKGKITYKARSFSDPVLYRADGSPTYTFCSVVDDHEFAITDIIRGEDHITNTAIQIQIFTAIGAKIPNFSHIGLLKTKKGEISKRLGGFSLRDLRSAGIDNMTICSYLAAIGSSNNVKLSSSFDKLQQDFALKSLSKNAIFYDENDLLKLNHKVISLYNYTEFCEKLKERKLRIIPEAEYLIIKDNLNNFAEVEKWHKIFNEFSQTELTDEERNFLKSASELLVDIKSDDYFKKWVANITNETGIKGRKLYHPIRLALTGEESGPELNKIIPYLGLEEVKKRLNG